MGANSYTPALLTRMSTVPNAFLVSANRLVHVRLLGDIGLHGDRLAAGLLDLGGDPLGVVFAARVIDYDVGSFLGKRLGDSGADALRSPGDDSSLTS